MKLMHIDLRNGDTLLINRRGLQEIERALQQYYNGISVNVVNDNIPIEEIEVHYNGNQDLNLTYHLVKGYWMGVLGQSNPVVDIMTIHRAIRPGSIQIRDINL